MSEEENSSGEKTYDPTPQRLEEARKKGDVPKSQDISAAAGYFGLLVAALAGGAASVYGFGAAMIAPLAEADRLAPARNCIQKNEHQTPKAWLAIVSHRNTFE